jgi:hypothetical protein
MTRVATLHQQRPGGVGDTSPARGRPVAHILLCLCCVCVSYFQVASCVLLKVRVYLSCWVWSDFPTGGALQACFALLHPCLRILLAIYRPQLGCVSSCALQ